MENKFNEPIETRKLQIRRKRPQRGQASGAENVQARYDPLLGYCRIHESLLGEHAHGGVLPQHRDTCFEGIEV